MQWKTPYLKEQDILPYIGCKVLDDTLNHQMQEMLKLLHQDARCQILYREFPLVDHQCVGMHLPGSSIQRLLKESYACLFMAATLGIAVDRRLRMLEQKDMGKAFMYNACANALIEALCDECNAMLIQEYRKTKCYLTDRFSCGYGDLPITTQASFVRMLDATKRIGLHVSASSILLPEKSVTAILGIAKTPQPAIVRGCRVCALYANCDYRKEGNICGKDE